MIRRLILISLFLSSYFCLQAQSEKSNNALLGGLKAGIVIQKTQKLYWENGFYVDLTEKSFLISVSILD